MISFRVDDADATHVQEWAERPVNRGPAEGRSDWSDRADAEG